MSEPAKNLTWRFNAAAAICVAGVCLEGAKRLGFVADQMVNPWISFFGLLAMGLAGAELYRRRKEGNHSVEKTEKIIEEVLENDD